MKFTKLLLQEVETVTAEYSPVGTEEEKSHALSKMQKLGSEKEEEANPIHRKVSNRCSLDFDLSISSLHVVIAIFCDQKNCS